MNTQIIVAVSFIVIAVIATYLVKTIRDKKIQKVYSEFAKKQGLNFSFDTFLFKRRPEINGNMDGYELKIHTVSDGAMEASERYYFTIAEINIPEFDLNLSISKENLIKGVGKFFGYQDVEMGNAALDKNYVFQTNQPEVLSRLIFGMNPELFHKERFGKHLWYENGKFTCKMKGIVKKKSDMEKLEGMLRLCIAMAKKKDRN